MTIQNVNYIYVENAEPQREKIKDDLCYYYCLTNKCNVAKNIKPGKAYTGVKLIVSFQ